MNSTISLLHEIYKALKKISLQSMWPEVVTELESRNNFWTWEGEYDDGKYDCINDDDDDDDVDENDVNNNVSNDVTPSVKPHSPSQSPSLDKDKKDKKKSFFKKDKKKTERKTFIVGEDAEGQKGDENEDDDKPEAEAVDNVKKDSGYVLNPLDVYISECYLNGFTPRQSFIDYISGALSDGYKELDITACLEPSERGGKVDYNEILGFLHTDKYFRGVSISGVLPNDGLGVFSRVLSSNGTLTRAVLRNVEVDEKRFVQFCDTLRMSENFSRICSLDLTGSPIKNVGLKALVRWIGDLNHGLVSLNLSNCDIQPKGFQAIFTAFKDNPTASQTIQSLTLTNNKLGDPGSAALGSWVASLPKGPLCLSSLGLAKCKVALVPLEPLGRLTLKYFDISDTQVSIKLSQSGSSGALAIFRNTRSPSTLVLNHCVFTDRPFFEAFTGNFITSGPGRKLEASEIQVKGVAQTLIPILLVQVSSNDNPMVGLTSMNVSGVPLTPKSMNLLSSALSMGETVRSLNISCPSKSVLSAENKKDWVFEIAAIASGAEKLVELNISGGYGQDIIVDLLENHAKDLVRIRSLDVSGNGLGEKGMNSILNIIKTNNTINRLAFDNNNVNLAMFTSIRDALNDNEASSLFSIACINDFTAEVQRVASDKEKFRMIMEVMKDIKNRLRANYARVVASSVKIPRTVTAYIPKPEYLDHSAFTLKDENFKNDPPIDSWK